MARFGLNRADKFGGQGGAGFFGLKGRKEAHIRFLYEDVSEVEGYAVHEIELGGKKRYVDCLRGEHDGTDKCPLCREGYFVQVKYFIPVYDEDTGLVLTWDKGKSFGKRLEKLFEKYAAEEPLCATCFTVTKETNDDGAAFISIKPDYNDGTELDELPEYSMNVYGNLVLEKGAEEMEEYIEYGDFYGEDAC